MDHNTKSNVIIGSKLAMAISNVVGSPFHTPSGTVTGRRRLEVVKIAKRCEALKCRSLKLLEVMKAQDSQITFDTSKMRNAAARKATKRVATVMGKMVEQQTSLHSKLETLLKQMLLQIPGGENSYY